MYVIVTNIMSQRKKKLIFFVATLISITHMFAKNI